MKDRITLFLPDGSMYVVPKEYLESLMPYEQDQVLDPSVVEILKVCQSADLDVVQKAWAGLSFTPKAKQKKEP